MHTIVCRLSTCRGDYESQHIHLCSKYLLQRPDKARLLEVYCYTNPVHPRDCHMLVICMMKKCDGMMKVFPSPIHMATHYKQSHQDAHAGLYLITSKPLSVLALLSNYVHGYARHCMHEKNLYVSNSYNS